MSRRFITWIVSLLLLGSAALGCERPAPPRAEAEEADASTAPDAASPGDAAEVGADASSEDAAASEDAASPEDVALDAAPGEDAAPDAPACVGCAALGEACGIDVPCEGSAACIDRVCGGFVEVTMGVRHACALRRDGIIRCWGWEDARRTIPPAGVFESLEAGPGGTCALDPRGDVACWGALPENQEDAPPGRWRQVSLGGESACGVGLEDSVVRCWGWAGYGQTSVPEDAVFEEVVVGLEHALGRRASGEVVFWGTNSNSQRNIPEGSYQSVATSLYTSCGVLASGGVVCWGGATSQVTSGVPAGLRARQVSVGNLHACAIREDATLLCWGQETVGQLDAPSGRFTQLSAGGTNTCAVREDGEVLCWGNDLEGETRPPWHAR